MNLRKTLAIVAVPTCVLALGACSSGNSSSDSSASASTAAGAVTITLDSMNDSGVQGSAVLTPQGRRHPGGHHRYRRTGWRIRTCAHPQGQLRTYSRSKSRVLPDGFQHRIQGRSPLGAKRRSHCARSCAAVGEAGNRGG